MPLKYTLIKVLLRRKKQRTPELHTAQFLPMLVDPARAFGQELGDLLDGEYLTGRVGIEACGVDVLHGKEHRIYLKKRKIVVTAEVDVYGRG